MAQPRSDNEALVGLIAGATVGALLTLLMAPTSGARLRASLRARLEAQTSAVAQKLPNNPAWGPETPLTGEQTDSERSG